jgi:type III restriction enzyme
MILQLRKSDLHFHSIRDINYNDEIWNAKGLSVLDEWANNAVKYCTETGLNFISVTDHNDFWASLALRDAIHRQKLSNDLWLLGGMEITSLDGLQAVVYFDLSYYNTEAKLSGLCGVLGITDIPEKNITSKMQCRHTTLNLEDAINHISKRDDKDYVLICPVVDGDKGLIRHKNGKNIYIKEEIVGGVVSQDVERVSQDVINGKELAYGKKAIGVLVTSDARKLREQNNGSAYHIGSAVTWIKISEPSCKALRQALISGRDKRIFYSAPTAPYNFISKLIIEKSKIFKEKMDFELHREYTTLIGGRGTGKSLVLFALMKALRQDKKFFDELDPKSKIYGWLQDQSNRYQSLFFDDGPFRKGTIFRVEIQGELNVEIECSVISVDEFKYKWRKLGSEKFEDGFPEIEMVNLCQFIQGELSEIGRSPERFKEILLKPIQREQRLIQKEIERTRDEYASKIKLQYEYYSRKKTLDDLEKKEKPLSEQITQLKGSFQKGLNPEEKEVLDKSQLVREINHGLVSLKEIRKEAELTLKKSIAHYNETLQSYIDILSEGTFIGEGWIEGVREIEKIAISWKQSMDNANKSLPQIDQHIQSLEKKRDIYQKRLDEVQGKVQVQQDLKLRLSDLETDLIEIKSSIRSQKEWLSKNSTITQDLKQARDDWECALKKRADLLSERADKIISIPGSKLKIKVLKGHGIDKALQAFKDACEGTWTPTDRFEILEKELLKDDPIKQWNILLADLIKAIESIKHGGNLPRDIDLLKIIFDKMTVKIVNKLIEDTSRIDRILTTELSDELKIYYASDAGEEIEINKASFGQQAVEFLKVILEETGKVPLVIDQPEDDLDNEFIQNDLLNLIYETRKTRQIIFVSHNANLVVNGDSGSIIIFDRIIERDGVKLGLKDPIGTIDQDRICESIKNIMEGGKEAFILRKRKYSIL